MKILHDGILKEEQKNTCLNVRAIFQLQQRKKGKQKNIHTFVVLFRAF